ncbi:MAG: GntR family transcriptional regulator [Chloroflexi bacterium]|nr:GntR family transcriptional regulator [Chloroflexota bacterium]
MTPAENPEINNLRASDKIEQTLRDMIITLELAPGAKISEAELIQRLGCGRTPLREALQRLAEEYLVIAVPRHGVSIAQLSLPDYVQLIEAVSHLEGIASRLAASRITATEIRKLELILNRSEAALSNDDILDFLKCDFDFHEGIAEASRNRYIIDTVIRLHRLTSRFIYLAWKNGGNTRVSVTEHRSILAALEQKNVPDSEHLTFEHTQNAKERIINAL